MFAGPLAANKCQRISNLVQAIQTLSNLSSRHSLLLSALHTSLFI